MTTITLSEQTSRNDGKFQVFGFDHADRFVFGVKSFEAKSDAEGYARRMMEMHAADHFERVTA